MVDTLQLPSPEYDALHTQDTLGLVAEIVPTLTGNRSFSVNYFDPATEAITQLL